MLILDLRGISFHAVVVFGLGKNLLFKSALGHCVKWSQPSQDELEAAQELIDEFLGKELASIRDFVDGKVELKKDQLQNSLTLISGIIIGKVF